MQHIVRRLPPAGRKGSLGSFSHWPWVWVFSFAAIAKKRPAALASEGFRAINRRFHLTAGPTGMPWRFYNAPERVPSSPGG